MAKTETRTTTSTSRRGCRLASAVYLLAVSRLIGAFSPHVTLSNKAVMIYDYSRDHCPNGLERLSYDVADGPPRVFRSPKDGSYLQFASVSSGSRGQHGPTPQRLKHSCHVYYNSTLSMNISLFSSHEMPFSPWVVTPTEDEDSGVVYALTDMEFHNTTLGFGGVCLYTATVLLKSTDGGYTFHHAAPAPDHVVAAMPYPPATRANATSRPPYMPAFRAVGNVVPHKGYYYATVSALWGPQPYGLQTQGVCIMRTDDISTPGSWRGWDGEAFAAGMRSFWWDEPYPAEHTCQPVLPSNMTHSTVFYSSVYDRFVALSTDLWMYFSHDLVRWENVTRVDGRTNTTDLYSFVFDPSNPDLNLHYVGPDAYFHYVTSLGPWPAGRNLMRRSLHFEAFVAPGTGSTFGH